MRCVRISVLCAFVLLAHFSLVDASVPLSLMEGFSGVVEKTSPAVVSIMVKKDLPETSVIPKLPQAPPENAPPNPRGPEMGAGSGVIIDPQGYIITNNHVVDGATSVDVRLADKREFKATIVGTDPKTDLAVVKIEGNDLPYLRWGNHDEIRVGDFVLAIGSPFGLYSTVTAGIVSALGRENTDLADYEDFIQTDAPINPGNSGGALVNMKGELIGINAAIFSKTGSNSGIGFAIPASIAIDVADSLMKTGKVVRGWLGVSIQRITPSLAQLFRVPMGQKGALITDVDEKGPAHEAGMKRGDVIVEFNGKKIASLMRLRMMIAKIPIGQKAKITVIRGEKNLTLEVSISERPPDEILFPPKKPVAPGEMEKTFDNTLAGVAVQELTPSAYEELQLPARVKGVVVTEVQAGSVAEAEGIQSGDVIMEINRVPITNLKEYTAVAEKIVKHDTVLLLVNRKGNALFIALNPKP